MKPQFLKIRFYGEKSVPEPNLEKLVKSSTLWNSSAPDGRACPWAYPSGEGSTE